MTHIMYRDQWPRNQTTQWWKHFMHHLYVMSQNVITKRHCSNTAAVGPLRTGHWLVSLKTNRVNRANGGTREGSFDSRGGRAIQGEQGPGVEKCCKLYSAVRSDGWFFDCMSSSLKLKMLWILEGVNVGNLMETDDRKNWSIWNLKEYSISLLNWAVTKILVICCTLGILLPSYIGIIKPLQGSL